MGHQNPICHSSDFQLEKGVVGLIPSGGRARRISPLPCSKELYPIGFKWVEGSREPRVKVVGQYLLEKFRKAGITKTYIVLREGKWDIPAYFSDGKMVDIHLAYLVITNSCGPPDTLDRAYPFLENNRVAFGFPDIIFGPDDVFDQLLRHLSANNSDVVLGLYPAHDFRVMDMVEVGEDRHVHSLVLKPVQTHLRYTWICGVWKATFTEFMHQFLSSLEIENNLGRFKNQQIDAQGDLPMGAVIQAAIQKGLRVEGVPFPNETYIDIGTPEDLAKAVRMFYSQ